MKSEKMILAKKIMVSTGLSLAAGIMIAGGTVVRAADTSTPEEISQSNTESYTDGSCKLTLTDGVLTIGAGKLSESGENSNLASVLSGPSSVTKIVIEPGVIAPDDSSFLFSGFSNLETIDGGSNLNTSNVSNMNKMFYNLTKLKSVDVSKFDTSKVAGMENYRDSETGMHYMFAFDSSLQNLDVSNWDVTNVTTVLGIFAKMTSLKEIDTSKWVAPNTSEPDFMFTGDSSLEKLGIGNIKNLSDAQLLFTLESGESNDNIKELILGPGASLPSYPGLTEGMYKVVSGDSLQDIDVSRGIENSTSEPMKILRVTNENFVINEVMRYSKDGTNQTQQLASNVVVDKGGKTLTADVPEIAGYTSDPSSVTFNIPADESNDKIINVSSNEIVKYTKNGSTTPVDPNKPTNPSKPNNSNHTSTPYSPIKDVSRMISVYPDKGSVKLYKEDTSVIDGKTISQATHFSSDKTMTKSNVTYYHYKDDQWVKATDSYPYEDMNLVIETKDHTQYLTSSEGSKVMNRALAGHSAWKTDRLAYIDGKTYYRVATNEFVPTEDVTVK